MQTTKLAFGMIILSLLFLIGNLLLKVSTYGLETGIRSTALTFEMLSKPIFSPLKWSSYPETSLLHFVVNICVFYFIFIMGFWLRQYYKVAGTILLLVLFITAGIWYYVYILSNAVI